MFVDQRQDAGTLLHTTLRNRPERHTEARETSFNSEATPDVTHFLHVLLTYTLWTCEFYTNGPSQAVRSYRSSMLARPFIRHIDFRVCVARGGLRV